MTPLPAATTVHLQFAVDWPWIAVVALWVAAAVFVLLFYRRVRRSLPGGVGRGLVALRLVAVALLFLLIFRPVFSFERRLKERPRLLFLIDTSGSMSIRDFSNQADRLSRVTERLGVLAREVGDDFESRYVAFDASPRTLDGPSALRGLESKGKATHISRAVTGALAGRPKQDLAAFFLLTDGIDNSADDPVQACADAEVPIITVGIGSRLRQEGSFRDILVENIEHPTRATVNNVVLVDAFIESLGYPDRVVDVHLMQDDRILAAERVVLDNKEGPQKASLKFTPPATGQFGYRVTIPVDDTERIRENNEQSFTMTITDPKIRVLYIEGTLRTEYRELRRVLETDPNVELLSLIRVDETTFNQQGNIRGVTLTGFPREKKEMLLFDVFIIGDLDRTFFSDAQLNDLREVVREGRGLLMIGGYHSLGPGGYGRTPVEEMLPVFLGTRAVGQEKAPFIPRLTAAGVGHPIFDGITGFFPRPGQAADRELPNLLGCVMTAGPQPGGQVLAVHPARRDAKGNWLTVAAVKQFGGGRTMVFTADTTWQWSLALRALRRESPFVRFWGQAIRWLASKELKERATKPGVEAFTDRTYYRPGEKIVFSAAVRAEEGRATNRAVTSAAITLPNGEKTSLALPYRTGTTGEYGAEFEPPEPGDYTAVVSAASGETGALYGRTELTFQVGRPNLEFDSLDINEALLRRIARETDGQYIELYDVATIIQGLRRARRERQVQHRVTLCGHRQLPIIFAAFILIVTGEWILRKRYQLS